MIQENTLNFGEHLMIDGYQGDEKQLNDKSLIYHCLDELPSLIGVKKFSSPQVFYALPNDKKDPGGWSGFVMIAESHISIHTFPKRGFITIDVYTCKTGLDTRFITEYFVKKFELKDTEVNFLRRGTKYPIRDIY